MLDVNDTIRPIPLLQPIYSPISPILCRRFYKLNGTQNGAFDRNVADDARQLMGLVVKKQTPDPINQCMNSRRGGNVLASHKCQRVDAPRQRGKYDHPHCTRH